MKKPFLILLTFVMMLSLNGIVFAEDIDDSASNIVSYDEETGVTVYRDAAGGLVFSGLEVPYTATEEEQKEHMEQCEKYESEYEYNKLKLNMRTMSMIQSILEHGVGMIPVLAIR